MFTAVGERHPSVDGASPRTLDDEEIRIPHAGIGDPVQGSINNAVMRAAVRVDALFEYGLGRAGDHIGPDLAGGRPAAILRVEIHSQVKIHADPVAAVPD